MTELLSVSSKSDIDMILALAIHECTHLFDGVSRHDESFASAFTVNVAKCARLIEYMPKLKRSVYADVKSDKPAKAQAARQPREELGGEIRSVEDDAPSLEGSTIKLWDADKWDGVTCVAIDTPKGLVYEFFIQTPARTGKGTFARVGDRQARLILSKDFPGHLMDENDTWAKLRLLRNMFGRNYPGDYAGVTYAVYHEWPSVYYRWKPYDMFGMVSENALG